MDGWMDASLDGRMDAWMWMDGMGCMDGWMWIDVRMDGWVVNASVDTYGWMDGWTHGWAHGFMDVNGWHGMHG